MRTDTIRGWTLYYFMHVVVTPALAPSDEVQTRVDDEELTCIAFPNTCRSFANTIHGPASSILASFSLGASLGFAYNVAPIICVGRCGYYFIQHRQSCGYYSRADTIRRVDTIRGNTVIIYSKCTQSLIIRFLIHSCLIVHMSNI